MKAMKILRMRLAQCYDSIKRHNECPGGYRFIARRRDGPQMHVCTCVCHESGRIRVTEKRSQR